MTLPALSNGIRSRPVFVPSGGRQRQGGMGRNNRRQDPAAKASCRVGRVKRTPPFYRKIMVGLVSLGPPYIEN
jgi:hypothetical protein